MAVYELRAFTPDDHGKLAAIYCGLASPYRRKQHKENNVYLYQIHPNPPLANSPLSSSVHMYFAFPPSPLISMRHPLLPSAFVHFCWTQSLHVHSVAMPLPFTHCLFRAPPPPPPRTVPPYLSIALWYFSPWTPPTPHLPLHSPYLSWVIRRAPPLTAPPRPKTSRCTVLTFPLYYNACPPSPPTPVARSHYLSTVLQSVPPPFTPPVAQSLPFHCVVMRASVRSPHGVQ